MKSKNRDKEFEEEFLKEISGLTREELLEAKKQAMKDIKDENRRRKSGHPKDDKKISGDK